MFYRAIIKDHIRVPPNLFNLEKEEAVLQRVKVAYDGYISKQFGIVIDVSSVDEVLEGVFIPGDGAAYYQATFQLLVYKPELHEIVYAKVKDIADFGAFMLMGPVEGMIHISQTMNDFVSFSKEKTLAGKDTKRTLKAGDLCRARIVAVGYKDLSNPKIGLTMRSPGLGKLDWAAEDFSGNPKKAPAEKSEKKK